MSASFPLVLQEPEYDYGLFLISKLLADRRMTLEEVRLPKNVINWSIIEEISNRDAEQAHHDTLAVSMKAQLNLGQLQCFSRGRTVCYGNSENSSLLSAGPWRNRQDFSLQHSLPSF
jgi:hypothetical protein